jgi:hypothetical protein
VLVIANRRDQLAIDIKSREVLGNIPGNAAW